MRYNKQLAEVGRQTLKENREFIDRIKLLRDLLKYSKETRSALCLNCFHWGDYEKKCGGCNMETMIRISVSSLAKFFEENDISDYIYFSYYNQGETSVTGNSYLIHQKRTVRDTL